MSNFERIKFYYDKGWANKDKLKEYVMFKVISQEEYEVIVKEVYVEN